MKMTKEEAIRNFREHWASLAISGSEDKNEYLRRHGFPHICCNCFLCEYTKEDDIRDCDKCPVEWPETNTDMDYKCGRSFYGGYWERAKSSEDRKRLAAIIRDLPEKEVEEPKPEPKFKVGDKVVPMSKNVWFIGDPEPDCTSWKNGKFQKEFLTIKRLANNDVRTLRGKIDGGQIYLCDGDYYLESDLRPYVEPEKKEHSKRIDCEWTEFKVGDLVEIIASGGNFPNYTPFFELNNLMQFRDKFVKDSSPIRGKHYRIVAIGKHKTSPRHNPLYVLQCDNGQVYIMTNTHKEMQLIAPEFKAGDRVRVKNGLVPDKWYNDVRFAQEMSPYLNADAVITRVSDPYGYRLDIDGGKWFWSKGMLEPMPSINHCPEDKTITVQTITIKFKGPETICTIKNQFGTFKGKAKCHPTDQWNEKTGADLALGRAVEKFNEYEPDA